MESTLKCNNLLPNYRLLSSTTWHNNNTLHDWHYWCQSICLHFSIKTAGIQVLRKTKTCTDWSFQFLINTYSRREQWRLLLISLHIEDSCEHPLMWTVTNFKACSLTAGSFKFYGGGRPILTWVILLSTLRPWLQEMSNMRRKIFHVNKKKHRQWAQITSRLSWNSKAITYWVNVRRYE